MPNQLHSHPRKFGKDSRACRVCNTTHGLIRKYQLMICRRCFREQANLIGFHKYRWTRTCQLGRSGAHDQTTAESIWSGHTPLLGLPLREEWALQNGISLQLVSFPYTELNYFLISFCNSICLSAAQGKLELFKGYKSSLCLFSLL